MLCFEVIFLLRDLVPAPENDPSLSRSVQRREGKGTGEAVILPVIPILENEVSMKNRNVNEKRTTKIAQQTILQFFVYVLHQFKFLDDNVERA